jgi:hypothetical protein
LFVPDERPNLDADGSGLMLPERSAINRLDDRRLMMEVSVLYRLPKVFADSDLQATVYRVSSDP